MGLHVGKKMGPGSVPPSTLQTNIQVNMNAQLPAAVQAFLAGDMMETLKQIYGTSDIIIEAKNETSSEDAQGEKLQPLRGATSSDEALLLSSQSCQGQTEHNLQNLPSSKNSNTPLEK